MRVKRPINLPFSEAVENENDNDYEDTMESFKPLETHHVTNGKILDVSLKVAHTHTRTPAFETFYIKLSAGSR